MNPEKTVVLKTYSLLSCAETAATTLKARGVECLIQSDDCGGMLAPLSLEVGVRLVVEASDEELAGEILSAIDTEAATPC